MSNLKEILNSEENVLINFHAQWCGPCNTLDPILKSVKDEFGDVIRIVKIDVDKHKDLASKMGVRGVPTMFFYKNGKMLKSLSGVLTASEIKKQFNL
jgi:thioredoxin 1|tara:strand:+ start:3853 stop:4143 length:291 start_codon:yes stop_codon:yes gene_type:complete